MDLKQLEAFVHVAELGSFTRAATILDTTQPALSRLVRQLELELRQNLLTRNGRGVAVSAAGQVMLAHAKGILSQVERATQDLQELRGTVGGHFSIGLTPSAAKVVTHELVRRFRASFPDATISVAEGLSTYLIEWLMMGRIDAAVLYDTAQTPLITKRAVFAEELFLMGRFDDTPEAPPTSGAIRLKDIGRYPLVIPGRMHAIRHIVESRAAQAGAKLTIALEVDAVTSILDMVCEGYGYAVLPLNAASSDPLKRRFRIERITDPTLMSQLTIATSSQHTLSHLAHQAVTMVEQEVLPLYTDARRVS
jgi:LysR family nitrogen assimilation transcriptional regulator